MNCALSPRCDVVFAEPQQPMQGHASALTLPQRLQLEFDRVDWVALLHAGVEKIHGLGELSDYEKECLKAMMPDLISQIEKGVAYVKVGAPVWWLGDRLGGSGEPTMTADCICALIFNERSRALN